MLKKIVKGLLIVSAILLVLLVVAIVTVSVLFDRYVDKGNSALFTHDSMSYHKGTADAAVTKASDLNIFTKKFKTRSYLVNC